MMPWINEVSGFKGIEILWMIIILFKRFGSSVCLYAYFFIYSYIHLSTHSLTPHSLTHSFIRSFIYSFIHSLVHSFIHTETRNLYLYTLIICKDDFVTCVIKCL